MKYMDIYLQGAPNLKIDCTDQESAAQKGKQLVKNPYSGDSTVVEINDLYQVVIRNIVVLSKALFCCGWCSRCSCSRILNIQILWFI